MTPSDDLSPPRRPIFFPVVIATVFLTIIGGTFGFMLGERHRRDGGAPSSGHTPTTQGYTQQPTSAAPTGPLCPDEAIQFAASQGLPTDLRQVFKIVTNKGSTVWICEDGAGALYFQSKTGGVDKPLIQGTNALFLDGVNRVGDDQYEVTAKTDGNRFEINRQHLVVHFTNGKPDQVDTVISVE